jgi:hypothetical protein
MSLRPPTLNIVHSRMPMDSPLSQTYYAHFRGYRVILCAFNVSKFARGGIGLPHPGFSLPVY